MKDCRIIFGPSFDRCVRRLKKHYHHIKEDVHTAISLLEKRPRAGRVMPGSSGMRKLRISNTDLAKGKSSGYRLIYCVDDSSELTIYLLLLYCKTRRSDVTTWELRELLDELTALME